MCWGILFDILLIHKNVTQCLFANHNCLKYSNLDTFVDIDETAGDGHIKLM